MTRRRRAPKTSTSESAPALDDFHDWVLGLPWVIERPYSLGTPGVRSFAVDCEALGLRQLWLLTGLQRELEVDGNGIAVIVPLPAAAAIEDAGWGRTVALMPAGRVVVTVSRDAVGRREHIEALVLTAYNCAMS